MSGEKKRATHKARSAKSQQTKPGRRQERRAEAVEAAPSVAPAYGNRSFTKSSTQGISITVQIPPLRRPKDKTAEKPSVSRSKRYFLIPAVLVPLAVVGLVIILSPNSENGSGKGVITKGSSAAAASGRTQPDYEPLVPSAEKASAPRYDAKRDLVSYTTTFSGARITVSQQELPANFSQDPKAAEKAAASIKATQRVDTVVGTVYIANNDKDQSQMALFAGKKVLLFIHVDRKLDDTSWKSFIELLRAKSWQELG
jgi:hypothetical protein